MRGSSLCLAAPFLSLVAMAPAYAGFIEGDVTVDLLPFAEGSDLFVLEVEGTFTPPTVGTLFFTALFDETNSIQAGELFVGDTNGFEFLGGTLKSFSTIFDDPGPDTLTFFFENTLTGSAAGDIPLTFSLIITGEFGSSESMFFSEGVFSADGRAVITPLPAALPLFAAGSALFAVALYSTRRRKDNGA